MGDGGVRRRVWAAGRLADRPLRPQNGPCGLSILLYSLSPVCATLQHEPGWFLFFRCTTFVGVCVEFIAAITWLAELFPKAHKEIVLG